ncbi:MAG: hypothetical protein M3010_03270 [Candidatus Dormibacteraeota bacterium]|nr:hypothetical protein [Candidatus Dormibacteraeota bacterium]
MRIQIVVLPTGEIGVFTQDGNFADGVQAIEQILRDLGAAGLPLEPQSAIEQHRHADAPAVQTAPQSHT